VPGFAPSGIAWADRSDPRPLAGLVAFLGALVTLAGGAAALLAPVAAEPGGGRRRVLGSTAVSLVVVLTAVCWGLYAAFSGPELALGVPAVAALARLPALHAGPAGPALVAAVVLGFGALLVATSEALRARVVGLAGGDATRGRLAWGAAVLLASLLALPPGGLWDALGLACGLAAVVAVAPALASTRPFARGGGAAAGAVVFAALALPGGLADTSSSVLAAAPALVAAPLAWLVTRALEGVAAAAVAPDGRG
jgi:hypothetical protein